MHSVILELVSVRVNVELRVENATSAKSVSGIWRRTILTDAAV